MVFQKGFWLRGVRKMRWFFWNWRKRNNKLPRSERERMGRRGEQAVARYLVMERGWRLLAGNWREGRHELDLVARVGKVLVFVEVRLRSAEALIGPYESINPRKRKALRNAIYAYCKAIHPQPPRLRFDIVEVLRHPNQRLEIRHHEGINLGL